MQPVTVHPISLLNRLRIAIATAILPPGVYTKGCHLHIEKGQIPRA